MSRPKAWNGTQWVDPSFWTGSQWKTYIPPAYDVDANGAYYGWPTSSTDGWDAQTNTMANPARVESGALVGEVEPGLMGYVYLRADSKQPGTLDGTRTIYANFRMNVVSQPGTTSPNPISCRVSLQKSGQKADLSFNATPGQSTGYVTRKTPNLTVTSGDYIGLEAYADAGALSGYGTCKIYLDWVEIIDAATGQRLKQLGNPGWEPKVKRSDGTWK